MESQTGLPNLLRADAKPADQAPEKVETKCSRATDAYFGLSGHLFRFHPARRFGVIRPA